jgi:predicted Na+-dependent transporter
MGNIWIEITSHALLFSLVFGMSATVEVHQLKEQLKNAKAICAGLFLQFVVLPFLGFLAVTTFSLDHPTGIALLVVTSSPGGSYSNWWCSMFNADLALSVAMTAISTIVSTVMLPLNLLIYANIAYNEDVVATLDWGSLISALLIVIAAISGGLLASAKFGSNDDFRLAANRLGNLAGVLLVSFSCIMSNTDKDARIWNREATFYGGVAAPCIIGLVLANIVTSSLSLCKAERVTVSIECCYQNVGIATSVALSMFRGDELAEAVAVPFFYGFVEAMSLLTYCIGAWKMGWTKAPSDVSFWTMLFTSYEVIHSDEHEKTDEDDYHFVEMKQEQTTTPTTVPTTEEKVVA